MLVSEMSCVNYYAGRYDDSVRYYRQALATAPWSVLANWGLGRSVGREGKYGEALQLLKNFDAHYGTEHPLVLGEIGYIQALSGDRKAAHVTIERLEFLSHSRLVDPYFVAQIYHGLNDRDSTYARLDKAYTIRSPFLVSLASLASDPKWSSEQADPRFQQLWNRMTASGGRSASSSPTTAGN
jgi:tetratricopeptide (TPR) repeat protein